jgi:hypothetical protein
LDDVELEAAIGETQRLTNEFDTWVQETVIELEDPVTLEFLPEDVKDNFIAVVEQTKSTAINKTEGIKIQANIGSIKVDANKKIKELQTEITDKMIKMTDVYELEVTEFDDAFIEFEEKAQKIADDLAIDIAIETEYGKNLMTQNEKLAVDLTVIPQVFVAEEAVAYLNNEEFMKKTGETIKAEITTVIEKEKVKAEQKVEKLKVDSLHNDLLAQLEEQKRIIEESKAKTEALKDEKEAMKAEFLEVNDYTEVSDLGLEQWYIDLSADPKDAEGQPVEFLTTIASVEEKQEKVEILNERLEIAIQSRDIKREKIIEIEARLKKLHLKLELNQGDKDEILAKIEKEKAELKKKQDKFAELTLKMDTLELKKERVEKLIVKNKLSWDVKVKEELDAELIQLDLDIKEVKATKWNAKEDVKDAEAEIDGKLETFQEELQVIEEEEIDDELFEEIA